MKVLITGSKGFIAKNLINYLRLNTNYQIFEHHKKKSLVSFVKQIDKSDVIIHLAGSNREKLYKYFKKNNENLTEFICKNLKKKHKIIFSSTTQIEKNKSYVLSKKNCENILNKYQKKTKFSLCIMKLNNIFGKWCKPNYNSVIATYCFSIPRKIPVYINKSNKKLSFTYIEDLNYEILKLIKKTNLPKRYFLKKKYKLTITQIYNYIASFEQLRVHLRSNGLTKGFLRKLYSVYLTYIPKNLINKKLIIHKDYRGNFVELLKSDNEQISMITINPKKERGNHFHLTKVERFYPIYGEGKVVFSKIENNSKNTIKFDSKKPKIIETIPGIAHKIINTTNKKVFMLIWSNEIYNPKKPDTFKFNV